MVRLEELEALDLMLWLQNGCIAAEVAGTNQSTICRRARRAMDTFAVRLLRRKDAWQVSSPMAPLLNLQRQVHQQWRLRTHQGLRLNVPYWSRQPLRHAPLSGWIINPENGPLVCENPLKLLRAHVIDACLITPTQLAQDACSDLALFELYRTWIDLHVFVSEAEDQHCWDSRPQDLLAHGRLDPLPFLPSSCRLSSLQRFETLRRELHLPVCDSLQGPEPSSASAPRLAFLTPVMAYGRADLRPLQLQLNWPYRECLAVLRSNADQPPIQALTEQLGAGLPQLLTSLVPGGLRACG